MDILTKALVAVGTVLVWLPIVATIVIGVIGSIQARVFRVDYLMPAELFPVALIGAVLLLWASLRARSRRGLFLLGVVLLVGLWFGTQAIAEVTGLASARTEAAGWPWALVIAALVAYTLVMVAVGIGGVLLVRDLFQKGNKGDHS